jgi:hypothetical protein
MPLANAQCTCNNDLVYEAERAYRSDFDPQKAVKLYKEAFANSITEGSAYLEAIECAAMIGDTASAIHFLEKGLGVGLTTSSYKKLWGQLGKGISYPYVMRRMDTTVVKQYKTALRPDINAQLQVMADRDQKYRSEDGLEDKQRALDSVNWKALQAMVTSLGRLPTYIETGFDGAENLEVLFYHMDKDVLAWFIPYVIDAVRCGQSNLGEPILYQLDRVGMAEGLIYTVSDEGLLLNHAPRTRMKNLYYCQAFGQWFDEQNPVDRRVYETPFDPNISIEETNRVRKLFCLDSLESKRQRKPWAAVVDVKTFEAVIK